MPRLALRLLCYLWDLVLPRGIDCLDIRHTFGTEQSAGMNDIGYPFIRLETKLVNDVVLGSPKKPLERKHFYPDRGIYPSTIIQGLILIYHEHGVMTYL
ncbi:hypothetical protein GGR51DRAFT_510692 [Nemania sp. FL0031]|nr:hypothetical protein GGR51DRAFT_510692 [Nemania sp. FL0031]